MAKRQKNNDILNTTQTTKDQTAWTQLKVEVNYVLRKGKHILLH
jgi:hypothetical protein